MRLQDLPQTQVEQTEQWTETHSIYKNGRQIDSQQAEHTKLLKAYNNADEASKKTLQDS